MIVAARIAAHRRLVDRALRRCIPARRDTLSRAMRYSLFSGGKRLRPLLLLAAGEAVGGAVARLMPFACGIEMIHTYSLIHDDLPAMDDDALRRGKPTTHRVFGEGMALLAGDALLTEAFRVMTAQRRGDRLAAASRIAALQAIAAGAGMHGMVGGQVADLEHEGSTVDLATVRSIHCRKTAAVIEAAVKAGGLVGGASGTALRALTRYGHAVGLAVQIADDLRDAEASTAVTGKVVRRDRVLGKATYPSVLGIAATREALGTEVGQALRALRPLGKRAGLLAELVRQVDAWGGGGRVTRTAWQQVTQAGASATRVRPAASTCSIRAGEGRP